MTSAVAPNERRRGDVHAVPDRVKLHHLRRGRSRRSDHSAAQLTLGRDEAGRFIGPRDVERGCDHFWRSRTRPYHQINLS